MKLWLLLVGWWAALRVWLMLSVSTIACTALLTYLVLHQGAQLDEPEAFGVPPRMDVMSATQNNEAVILQTEPPTALIRIPKPTVIGVPTSVNMRLRNDGGSVLKIALVAASCGCSEITVGGTKMEAVGDKEPAKTQLVELEPAKETDMVVTWKAEEKNRAMDGTFRLSLIFNVNDPRWADRARMEIATPLMNPK